MRKFETPSLARGIKPLIIHGSLIKMIYLIILFHFFAKDHQKINLKLKFEIKCL